MTHASEAAVRKFFTETYKYYPKSIPEKIAACVWRNRNTEERAHDEQHGYTLEDYKRWANEEKGVK